jgi:hypothetical protein
MKAPKPQRWHAKQLPPGVVGRAIKRANIVVEAVAAKLDEAGNIIEPATTKKVTEYTHWFRVSIWGWQARAARRAKIELIRV